MPPTPWRGTIDVCLNLSPEGDRTSPFLWFALAAIYLTALIFLGLSTLRKGHTVLFWLGIIFPILWIVGALMAPTQRRPPRSRTGPQRSASRQLQTIIAESDPLLACASGAFVLAR